MVDILSILENYNKIFVWGTGNYLKMYSDSLPENYTCFIDSDPQKQGNVLFGKQILSPDILRDENSENSIVIVCNYHYNEIVKRLQEYGDFTAISIEDIAIIQSSVNSYIGVAADLGEIQDYVLAFACIHAELGINGARRFIDANRDVLSQNRYNVLDIIPLRHTCKGGLKTLSFAVYNNGRCVGIECRDVIRRWISDSRGLIIHALYYGLDVIKLIDECVGNSTPVVYYLHDYACFCENRFFYKEDKPCIIQDERFLCDKCDINCSQLDRRYLHNQLFLHRNVTVIAPSDDVYSRFKLFFKESNVATIPHLKYRIKKQKAVIKHDRLRIAFLGHADSFIKGWSWFEYIAEIYHEKYDFYCLGRKDGSLPHGIKHISVSFDNEERMPYLLKKENIDIACILSLWPETYSYTYYEGLEAGCFILTTSMSGNVSKSVQKDKTGKVFSLLDELVDWLNDEQSVRNKICEDRVRITDVVDNDEFICYLS